MKTTCGLAPLGWKCQRAPEHEGPCAAQKLTAEALATMPLDEYVKLRSELLHQAMVKQHWHTEPKFPLHPERAPLDKLPIRLRVWALVLLWAWMLYVVLW